MAAEAGEDNEHDDNADPFKTDRVGGKMDGFEKECQSVTISVLTLNLWDSLKHTPPGTGVKELVNLIKHHRADLIAFQDVSRQTLQQVAKALGIGWKTAFAPSDSQTSVGLLTNIGIQRIYQFVATGKYIHVPRMQGVKISSGGLSFRVFNAHFPDLSLPELIRAGQAKPKGAARKAEFARIEHDIDQAHRRSGIYPALAGFVDAPSLDPKLPTIFLGTLNMPSHLDQNQQTRQPYVKARGLPVGIFKWPVSLKLQKAGFVDTYREQHPDVSLPENFGFTFPDAPVEKNPVFDRLDYIYVRDSTEEESEKKDTWTIISSDVIGQLPPSSAGEQLQHGRSWVSNHFGVLTVLRLNSGSNEQPQVDEPPNLTDIVD